MVLTIGVFPDAPSGGTMITDTREVKMNNKLMFCVLSDCSFEIFSLSPPKILFTIDVPRVQLQL